MDPVQITLALTGLIKAAADINYTISRGEEPTDAQWAALAEGFALNDELAKKADEARARR